MKIIFISVLALIFNSGILLADESSAKVSTQLSGSRGGTTYSGISFLLNWELIPFDGRKVKSWVGGDSLDPSQFVFKYIELTLESTKVPLPKHLYHDIYDPSQIGPFIMDDGKFLYLVINGGDGAGSIEAWLQIIDGKIRKRRIRSFGPDGEYIFRN